MITILSVDNHGYNYELCIEHGMFIFEVKPDYGFGTISYGYWGGSLLEIMANPYTQVITRFNLETYAYMHVPRAPYGLPEEYGLPIISYPKIEYYNNADGVPRYKIARESSFGYGKNFIEIDIWEIEKAAKVIIYKDIEFYINVDTLVGIRVNNLSEVDMDTVFKDMLKNKELKRIHSGQPEKLNCMLRDRKE